MLQKMREANLPQITTAMLNNLKAILKCKNQDEYLNRVEECVYSDTEPEEERQQQKRKLAKRKKVALRDDSDSEYDIFAEHVEQPVEASAPALVSMPASMPSSMPASIPAPAPKRKGRKPAQEPTRCSKRQKKA